MAIPRPSQRLSGPLVFFQRVSDMPRGGPRPGAGRPAGQPNRDTAARRAALADLLIDQVETAITTLAELATSAQSETARLSAATAILDRVYGRPAQAVDLAAQVDLRPQIIIKDCFHDADQGSGKK